ncbi:uncharacterized protein LOC129752884 [Uranotaenia lowii]|uniref:uncharacterized protein LOC129752884 n=1 Tax=Uranotaenia lowii TaxID=190385 RepID=UPI002478A77A|nr:uncharacterized protein LOC129752884 [Uranotaenia lowii]
MASQESLPCRPQKALVPVRWRKFAFCPLHHQRRKVKNRPPLTNKQQTKFAVSQSHQPISVPASIIITTLHLRSALNLFPVADCITTGGSKNTTGVDQSATETNCHHTAKTTQTLPADPVFLNFQGTVMFGSGEFLSNTSCSLEGVYRVYFSEHSSSFGKQTSTNLQQCSSQVESPRHFPILRTNPISSSQASDVEWSSSTVLEFSRLNSTWARQNG